MRCLRRKMDSLWRRSASAPRRPRPTGSIFSGVTEIRPGTYILINVSQGHAVGDMSCCAATVLATVMSRPTDERVILDVGAKDLTMRSCHDLLLFTAPELRADPDEKSREGQQNQQTKAVQPEQRPRQAQPRQHRKNAQQDPHALGQLKNFLHKFLPGARSASGLHFRTKPSQNLSKAAEFRIKQRNNISPCAMCGESENFS